MKLGASDLLSQVHLRAMVTLMVENIFSLMRKDDLMPTQLEYGTRRLSYLCERTPEAYVQGSLPLLHGPKKLLP